MCEELNKGPSSSNKMKSNPAGAIFLERILLGLSVALQETPKWVRFQEEGEPMRNIEKEENDLKVIRPNSSEMIALEKEIGLSASVLYAQIKEVFGNGF